MKADAEMRCFLLDLVGHKHYQVCHSGDYVMNGLIHGEIGTLLHWLRSIFDIFWGEKDRWKTVILCVRECVCGVVWCLCVCALYACLTLLLSLYLHEWWMWRYWDVLWGHQSFFSNKTSETTTASLSHPQSIHSMCFINRNNPLGHI